jgi:hypothetical protein
MRPPSRREGRDQVEDEEPGVDEREPAEHGERRARVVAQDQGVGEVRAAADRRPDHAGGDDDQQRDAGPPR